jgi:hypothetical protein
MIYVNLPIKSEVQLVAPMESCCNCGAATDVKPRLTDLRRMPLMGLAGTEIKLELPFPYCEACAATARRRLPSVIGVIAVSLLIAIALGMCWLFFGPQLSEEITTYVVAPVLVCMSFLIVLGFFFLRKPSGEQTSYYQPVKLRATGHKWPADITGLELAFTNKEYAKAFASANQAAVAAKILKVSSA